MVMHCPECGVENPDGSEYCSLCLTSLGFESAEFPSAEAHEVISMPGYPSSFAGAETSREPDSSGAGVPSDYSSPGDWTDAHSWEDEADVKAAHTKVLNWRKGILSCVYASVVAGAATLGLEFILGLIVLNDILSGNISTDYTWIFIVMLIPVCICTVYVGYRSRSYGWALGMITAVLWAVVTKPLFNLLFLWIMDAHRIASPFVWDRALLDLGVALPLGALLGWLGEKRMSGITIRT